MDKDQADILRNEAKSPHAVFHEFILELGKRHSDCYFLFFEGSEDPTFYSGFVLDRLADREYHDFVCHGRQGVIKVNELCNRDGRAFNRSLFFIDKDHSNLLCPEEVLPPRTFQTECYSFENHLVCKESFRRFWSERLHLRFNDSRYDFYIDLFEKLHQSFFDRMKYLMAIVLIGRGIGTLPAAKLNLNNVNLDNVLSIDFENAQIVWAKNGGRRFLSSSNMTASGIGVRGDMIRSILRKYLHDLEPKSYVRGKYELWFFAKFLHLITKELAKRHVPSPIELPRATPSEVITFKTAIDLLCGLSPIPNTLDIFLDANV